MSTYRLERIFTPRSVVLIGGSPRKNSVGGAVLRNLRRAGFGGAIGLVNPHHRTIEGITAVKTVNDLAGPPDLAVIATPAAIVARLHATLASTLNAPAMHGKLQEIGFEVNASSPAEFDKHLRSEMMLWRKVIGAAGLKRD